MEGLGVLLGGEVAALAAPAGDGVHHAADELAHAALAVRRAELAAEVLGDHDVGGRLRPELRHLDAPLLEDLLTPLVGNDGIAQLPFDRIEGIDPGSRVVALEAQTRCRSRRGRLRPRRGDASARHPVAHCSASCLVGMQGGFGAPCLTLLNRLGCSCVVPTAKAAGNAPAHYSRPTQELLRKWGSMTIALAIFRDAHLQRYACRLRESRGKPQDVVVCHRWSPRSGRGRREELTNPQASRQDFHSRICPALREDCGKRLQGGERGSGATADQVSVWIAEAEALAQGIGGGL